MLRFDTPRDAQDCAGTVLAVDDCPAMREIMRAALEQRGYSVHAVESGQAALQAVSAARFDVIVLDVEMPGMDGMALGHALRRTPRAASAAIAMHSQVAEAQVRAGFDAYDAYVPKGGDPQRLGEQVDRLLQGRRLSRQAASLPDTAARP